MIPTVVSGAPETGSAVRSPWSGREGATSSPPLASGTNGAAVIAADCATTVVEAFTVTVFAFTTATGAAPPRAERSGHTLAEASAAPAFASSSNGTGGARSSTPWALPTSPYASSGSASRPSHKTRAMTTATPPRNEAHSRRGEVLVRTMRILRRLAAEIRTALALALALAAVQRGHRTRSRSYRVRVRIPVRVLILGPGPRSGSSCMSRVRVLGPGPWSGSSVRVRRVRTNSATGCGCSWQ